MPDDVTLLREELAALRAELQELRLEHRQLLRQVGVLPRREGEPWPEFLSLEADCLAIRDDPMRLPIVMRAEGERAYIAFLDKNNRTRAELSIDETGPRFEMHNAAGELIFQLSEAEDGSGQMCVCDAAGKPRAGLRVNEHGGVVNVLDPKGKPQVVLTGSTEGGEIFAVNAMHKASATMKATARGGMVCVHEPSGQLMGFLSADTETGGVSIYGPHGAMAAGMVATESGGAALFYDVDGEHRATLPEPPSA